MFQVIKKALVLIVNIFSELRASNKLNKDNTFIGIERTGTQYMYTDGVAALSYNTPWLSGQPSRGSEYCVEILDQLKYANDITCSFSRYCLCEL